MEGIARLTDRTGLSLTDRAWRTKAILVGALCLALMAAGSVYAGKVSRNASAILRWRALVQDLARGENVYNEWTKQGSFPYPPIGGLLLWPIAQLPPASAAFTWFALKLLMAAAAIRWSIQLVSGPTGRFTIGQTLLLLALVCRPILSDLQHGNINILILFLTTGGLVALGRGREPLAGSLIALAGAIKVTPLLFFAYFLLKGRWKVAVAGLAALACFLFILPSTILGVERNWWLIQSWSGSMIEPYLIDGQVETLQTNQSLPGLLFRLMTECPGVELADGTQLSINWIDVSPAAAWWTVRLVILAILCWIGWLTCSGGTAARSHLRTACEYSLTFVAMLLISERSWKHHFVTMTLPYAVLVWCIRAEWSPRISRTAWSGIALGMLLMASTSWEFAGWLGNGQFHKYAQGYGMFCLSGVVVMMALSAVMMRVRGRESAEPAVTVGIQALG